VAEISLAGLGFILGNFMVPQFVRWICLVVTTVAPQEGDFLGPPRRRLLWATPFVLLMHPAPYLLVGIFWVAVRAAMGLVPYPWPPILAGFCAGVVLTALSMVLRLLRLHRLRSACRKAGKYSQ